MKGKWQKLEKWLEENAPRVLATLNPPASVAKIAEVEARFKVLFPPSVRESYLLHDGQPTLSWGLFGGSRFMSLDDVVDQVNMLIEIEKECHFGDFDPSLMIPVIDQNHSGDFYYVENSANNAETELIEWWHEEPTRDVKADSFLAFFDDFLNQVEAGNYVFHIFEPQRFSNDPEEYGLLKKAEFERMQTDKQVSVEREIINSEVVEQSDGKTTYIVSYREIH